MNDYEFTVLILGGLAWLLLLLREVAQAYNRGYKAGYAAADDWWISADRESDEARKQIWRDEPKKGMEQ